MQVTLTTAQAQAKGLAVTKLRDLKQHCKIGGYAGTGKTTLIHSIVEELERFGRKVAIMAPTGKAANVLSIKGVPATTIHRRLYELVNERPVEFRLRDTIDVDYFIIDESSMLSIELYQDICSFNKPTLFIGDPAQLEPVGDDAKLMHSADFVLTEIHRTASGSAIIDFATRLRTSILHPFAYSQQHKPSPELVFRSQKELRRAEWLAFDQIIVGTNKSRNLYNQTFKKGLAALPVKDDKLICLKNDYPHGVFNGETFTVVSDEFEEDPYTGDLCVKLRADDGTVTPLPFWYEFFENPTLDLWKKPREVVWLDYAYAITCHKSQGSEWDNVAVVDEAFGTPPNRWRYTAATRAAKHLTWIRK